MANRRIADAVVDEIRRERADDGASLADLAIAHDLDETTVYRILTGQIYRRQTAPGDAVKKTKPSLIELSAWGAERGLVESLWPGKGGMSRGRNFDAEAYRVLLSLWRDESARREAAAAAEEAEAMAS